MLTMSGLKRCCRSVVSVGRLAFLSTYTTFINGYRIPPVMTNSPQVVFLRHGQSTWNQQNIFIGMTDTPLTADGKREAMLAGQLLKREGFKFDAVYTSLLSRSISTVWIALEELGQHWLHVNKDFRLNERNYGALVGRHKKQCVEEYGKDQVKRWRRSWDEPPPPMSTDSPHWPGHDPRYAQLGITPEMIPLSESLKDVVQRTSVFWDQVIVPQLRENKRVLIVGHENNLRSLIKRLDDISEEDIINVELPRAIPLVYDLNPETLKPMLTADSIVCRNPEGLLSGRYLCTPEELKELAERDQRQVYDILCKENLELSHKTNVNTTTTLATTSISVTVNTVPSTATPTSTSFPANSHTATNTDASNTLNESANTQPTFQVSF